jgi:hypothetical protein
LVLAAANKIIIWIGETVEGSIHDKRLAEQAPLIQINQKIIADLGFMGLQKVVKNLVIPHKKPKGGMLTEAQKTENQLLSKERVVIEHIFASVKILRIVKDVCRCKKEGFRHLVFQIACGLHNFRLLT